MTGSKRLASEYSASMHHVDITSGEDICKVRVGKEELGLRVDLTVLDPKAFAFLGYSMTKMILSICKVSKAYKLEGLNRYLGD